MKRTIFFLLIAVLAGTLLFYNCKKKEYARLNPLDPLYSGAVTETNGGTIPGGPTAHTGTISFDRTGYQGITNHATITVVDADLTSTSLTVNVKSLTDPTGINFKLSGAAGTYTGKLGFTNNTSVSNWKINITNNDTITATYIDADPAGTRTDTAVVITNTPILTNFLGLYTESYTGPVWDTEIKLWNWNWTCMETRDITLNPFEGTKMQVGEVTNRNNGGWWGWGIAAFDAATHDRSAFIGGTMHLSIKSSNNSLIRVGVQDNPGGAHWRSLSAYGFTADGSWHTFSIPLSDFAGMNYSAVQYYFMMDHGGAVLQNGHKYFLDNVYWSKP